MHNGGPHSFEIPTTDGKYKLTGVLELPSGKPRCVTLIVPGGWFMDRDGFMGGCDDERCLMYREIAKNLLSENIAVVRYDNRGVRGNEFTVGPLAGEDELGRSLDLQKRTVRYDIRRECTTHTKEADILSVYRWLLADRDIPERRVVVLAHSEGGLRSGRLAGRSQISPAGFVFVGSIAESPKAALHWQMVDRYVGHMMGWSSGADGRLSATDIERESKTNTLLQEAGHSIEPFLEKPYWTATSLRVHFEALYDEARNDALGSDVTRAFPAGDFVAYSYDWWRSWFTDDRSPIEDFRAFEGPVIFHVGEIDSQAPGSRQILEARAKTPPKTVVFRLHEGRGHTLRTGEPTIGPIDPAATRLLVEDVLAILAEPN